MLLRTFKNIPYGLNCDDKLILHYNIKIILYILRRAFTIQDTLFCDIHDALNIDLLGCLK